MKWSKVLKLLLGIVVFILLLKFFTILFVEPWAAKKIEAELLGIDSTLVLDIKDVDILFLNAGVELKTIRITSNSELDSNRTIQGDIGKIKIIGLNLYKVIFKNEIDIRELSISNINSALKTQIPKKQKSPIISSKNIHIDKITFEKVDLAIKSATSNLSYVLKDGTAIIFEYNISKSDTLSLRSIENFNFKAAEVISVSADSLYEFKGMSVEYSQDSGQLTISKLSIHPNYKDYDFTAQSKFQTDRIEAVISNILIKNFVASDYLKSKDIVSSYIEIEKIKMEVFRDKRKIFKHQKVPAFQDVIYDYPGRLNIDSVVLNNGSITYLEHVENSNKRGKISFEAINAKLYKISNDTSYKKEDAFLEIKAEALLMGSSKIELSLKSKIFDRNNTFTVDGSLASLEAKALNPILENNAFLSANAGTIDAMHFNFLATNSKSSGKLIILYHGLIIDSKVPQKNLITAVKEIAYKIIARNKIMDSNPLPGDHVREGKIAIERDPEKFIFNYCFKSILSGIKSSLVKQPKEKRQS